MARSIIVVGTEKGMMMTSPIDQKDPTNKKYSEMSVDEKLDVLYVMIKMIYTILDIRKEEAQNVIKPKGLWRGK